MRHPRYWVNALPYEEHEVDDIEEAFELARQLKRNHFDVEMEDRVTGKTLFTHFELDL